MSENRIVSYSHADNLCKGTLGDENYSTCILNNLRFLPYMNDRAEALLTTNAGLITKGDISYLEGKTYVTGQPIALSDTAVRVLQKNDYGQVKFRCLDVAAKPMLPLMDLTDLGLEDKPLVVLNSISLPSNETQENLCDPAHGYLAGIPVKCPERCNLTDKACILESLIYNFKNYTIRLNNQYQTVLANCDAIGNLISSNGNYDNLRPKALEAAESLTDILAVHDIWVQIYTDILQVAKGTPYLDLVVSIPTAVFQTMPNRTELQTEIDKLNSNVITVINTHVNEHENWVSFQYYTELDTLAEYMTQYRKTSGYISVQNNCSIAIKLLNTFAYVPEVKLVDSEEHVRLNTDLALSFIFERYNLVSIILTKIHELYTQSNGSQKIAELKEKIAIYDLYTTTKWLWATSPRSFFNQAENLNSDIVFLIDQAANVDGSFNSVRSFVNTLGSTVAEKQLDTFYSSTGNQILVNLSSLYGRLQGILGLTAKPVTEVNLGGSFKDSGRYYFANVAYALGYGKLTNIYSIRINGAIYNTDSLTNLDGEVVTGISDSGCTRYKIKFKLFPDVANNSNLKELELYIYPGTPDQPYCPTMNKYHNFKANKYSGLFTKLLKDPSSEGTDTALYLFKGYKPLDNTVDEIINLGTASLNAIDLSKPDLDKDSTEAFLQKEIVSLTNSSSLIAGEVITSKDLKYYLKATLQGTLVPIEDNNPDATQGLNVEEANNYPYLSMVEFIDLPLGSGFKVPEIEFLIRAEDMVS